MADSTFWEKFKIVFQSIPEDDANQPATQRTGFVMGVPGYVVRSLMVWSSLIATLVLGALSGSEPVKPPFKVTNPEVADQCNTAITPSNNTFSIWGLIYMMQVIYALWQTYPSQKDHPMLGRLAMYISGAYVSSCFWLIAFGNSYVFTAELIIIVYLLCLLYAYYYLGVGLAAVNWIEYFCCFVPLSLHLAWVLVATILGLNIALVCGGDWQPTTDFSVMCLVIAALITVYIQLTRGDLAFAAVIMWAASGIREKTTFDATDQAAKALWWIALVSAILGIIRLRFSRREVNGFLQSRYLVFPDIKDDQAAAHRYRLGQDLEAMDFSNTNNPAVPLAEA